jgi:hypothetical protein
VKRWREGDHRERWAGSALLLAETKFPKLPTEIANHMAMRTKKGVAGKNGVTSMETESQRRRYTVLVLSERSNCCLLNVLPKN